MGRDGFGYRKNRRAKQELAEAQAQSASDLPQEKPETCGGGFIVTFSFGLGDAFTSLRVFVWAQSRAHALMRALSFGEVEDWLKEHPQARSSVMSAGMTPVNTTEGKLFSSRAA